jgi:hypothetical protein
MSHQLPAPPEHREDDHDPADAPSSESPRQKQHKGRASKGTRIPTIAGGGKGPQIKALGGTVRDWIYATLLLQAARPR